MRTSLPIAATFAITLVAVGCSKTSDPGAQPAQQQPAPAQQPAEPAAAPAPAAEPGAAPGAGAPAQAAPAAQGSEPAPVAPAAPAPPPPPPPPKYKEVTLAEGTTLGLRLDTSVASDTSKVEDPVRATLRKAIVSDHLTVLPEGTRVTGVVSDVARSGKVKGLAHVSLRFTSLTVDDERYEIRTSPITRQAKSTKKKDATKIGIGTGAGALIGAIAGGGKGAAIGAGVGAAGGTGMVMATRGEEVRLADGTALTVTLASPLTVRVLLPR